MLIAVLYLRQIKEIHSELVTAIVLEEAEMTAKVNVDNQIVLIGKPPALDLPEEITLKKITQVNGEVRYEFFHDLDAFHEN